MSKFNVAMCRYFLTSVAIEILWIIFVLKLNKISININCISCQDNASDKKYAFVTTL